jgi:tetratricopeptide (TPR) repeat protein
VLILRSDPQAADFATPSLALHRELGDLDKQAAACNFLGLAARFQGDNARSLTHLEESLALYRAVGNKRGIAAVSINLAAQYIDRDEMAAAVATYEEALPLVRTQDDRRLLNVILANLGLGYASVGRFAEARTSFAEAIRLMADVKDWFSLAFVLSLVALAASGEGESERAAQLLGAGAKLCAVTNLVLPPAQQRFVDRATVAATASLGEAAFAAAYERGRAWSVEESIARALAYLAA